MATKVIPNSLNYSDIKPESIDTDIKLSKFIPTSTITGARPGDMIKFMLTGQGFFDPYSAYFKFTVETPNLMEGEVRTLDRSAHSFIQRIIIRSQGVELERIENYDIIAAMINDIIYSPEQNAIHAWEGFPTHIMPSTDLGNFRTGYSDEGTVPYTVGNPVVVHRKMCGQLNSQGASPFIHRYVGEVQFSNDEVMSNTTGGDANARKNPEDTNYVRDYQFGEDGGIVGPSLPTLTTNGDCVPVDFAFHVDGRRVSAIQKAGTDSPEYTMLGTKKMTFIIPIYSGVMGVLQPDKKLLPLGLMPLDIEIYFNQHALYTNIEQGSRQYVISDFNIYSHVIFFESDIHKQLEAQTAEHGLFIYANSFHSAPQQLISGRTMPPTAHISMNLKSINSVHFVFTYTHYQTKPYARKLHFVSHGLTQMQLKNGQTLIPQYAIEGNSGSSRQGEYVPFLLELYKAFNKMHDPKTDAAIQAYNYCGDIYGGQFTPTMSKRLITGSTSSLFYLNEVVNKQANVGRCQYGISLEGEELGQDKMMITGRKTEYPFIVNFTGTKSSPADSFMFTFLRADFIIYIRPDLQIVTLGK